VNHDIREIIFVPSLMLALLELVNSDDKMLQQFRDTVQLVVLGGEAMTPALAKSIFDTLPDVALWNGYGPAECTIDTTTHRCTLADCERPSMPIGRPLPYSYSELYVTGPCVTLGYFGAPEITAKSLVYAFDIAPTPLYATGDLVQWEANGSGLLLFIGRADSQVKIRGQRLELSEVESVIRRPRGLSQVVVVKRDVRSESAEPYLAAYIVPASASALAASAGCSTPSTQLKNEAGAFLNDKEAQELLQQVQEECRARLPAYMVPRAWSVMNHLPLSPNGKIDRRRLPRPSTLPGLAPVDSSSDSDDEEAETARKSAASVAAMAAALSEGAGRRATADKRKTLQRTMTAIGVANTQQLAEWIRDTFARVLELPPGKVSLHATWPSLGGSSLQAMRLMAALRVHARALPINALFAYSSPQLLAQHLIAKDILSDDARLQFGVGAKVEAAASTKAVEPTVRLTWTVSEDEPDAQPDRSLPVLDVVTEYQKAPYHQSVLETQHLSPNATVGVNLDPPSDPKTRFTVPPPEDEWFELPPQYAIQQAAMRPNHWAHVAQVAYMMFFALVGYWGLLALTQFVRTRVGGDYWHWLLQLVVFGAGYSTASFLLTLGAYPVVLWWSGRPCPQQVSLHSPEYMRLLLCMKLWRALRKPITIVLGSPLYNWYLRLCGAEVGEGTVIMTAAFELPSLLRVGKGVYIGAKVTVVNTSCVRRVFQVHSTRIGDYCVIKVSTVARTERSGALE
jgi:hypothetical protein